MRTSTAKASPTCYCQACGKTVAVTEKFCTGCGAVLGDIQCPKCGNVGKPYEFVEGCPRCLYLNAKGNTKSGILRLDTLEKVYPSKFSKKEKGNAFSATVRRTKSHRPIAPPPEFSFFTNFFILIFLSFGLIGGFLWLNQ